MVAAMKPLHPSVQKVLNEKGEQWLVAAIVDGSIGYSDPKHARILIRDYKAGDRQDYCERCYALYGGDLEKMILVDIDYFNMVERNSPERAQRVIAFVQAWEEKVGDSDPLNSAGLFYPTVMI